MTLRVERAETGPVVTTVATGDGPLGDARIEVHYTLCTWGEELKAVTCVGSRITEGEDEPEPVALFTTQITDELPGDDDIVSLGVNTPPEAAWTIVPLAAQVLTALRAARVGMGWSGVVVGSGILSQILMGMGSNIGARDLTHFVPGEVSRIASEVAGIRLYVSAGLDNGELADLLDAVPERATIALVEEIAGPPIPINFYDTIHKKSLTVISPDEAPTPSSYRRARRYLDLRHAPAHPLPPVYEVEAGEHLQLPDSPTVILQWP